MQFATVNCVATRCLSIHQLLDGLLAELPAILDSFFIGYANTKSTHIGVVGSHKVVGSYKVVG